MNFPARNDSLAAHSAFEIEYHDVLHASPVATHVDIEGAAIWLQEYLRYRVNGCTHGDAVAKVLQQLGGGGIAPVCRSAVVTR